MGHKKLICKECGNEVYEAYIIDGVCASCRSTIKCSLCHKRFYESDMRADDLCKKCYKIKKKELEQIQNSYKLCPFCGEQIKVMATKCRFCNEFLDDNQHNTTKTEHAINKNIELQKNIVIESKSAGSHNKKTYTILFLILVLPAIINRILVYSGQILMTEDLAAALTILTKIGMIILTSWYAGKVKINMFWSLVLGLSTLLPFMTWVTLIILLSRKPDNK